MNLLNKLTTKNLKLNKKRTIVTIVGIMLSVALLTAVASIYASCIKSLINLEIRVSGNYHVGYINVPTNELDVFKNNRYIEKISITQDVGYANIQSENEYKPYAFIKKFNKEALNNLSVNLVEGRLPENENEIVIPTHLKTNGRNFLKVGDTITLDVGQRVDSKGNILSQYDAYQVMSANEEDQEKIINTKSVTYKVVGIIVRPSNGVENFSAPGFTFITYSDDGKLNGNVDVYVRYTKEGTKDWTTVTANILGVDSELFKLNTYQYKNLDEETLNKIDNEMQKAKYKIINNGYLIGLETNPNSTSGIDGLGTVLYIVLGIIVFTSVFCIKNSFDISITEKTKQYGMLRSIGATKKQIRRNVLFEATILGAIGIPLGLLLGCFASFVLIIVSNYFLADGFTTGFKLVLAISPIAILVAILLGIVTIYFSAFKSARRASKVSPISSIRNNANIKINSKKIKSPKIITKIFGIGGEISYKNLKRNRKKYRTTVISLTVSVLVFIALSSFMSMTFEEVDRKLKANDYNISLSGSINDNSERYYKYLSTTKLDNIDNFTVLRKMEYEVKDVKYNNEYLNWLGLKYSDLVREDTKPYIDVYTLGKEQYSKYVKSLGLNYNDIKDKAIVMDYARIGKPVEGTNKFEYKIMRIYDYKTGDVVINKNTNQSLQIGYVTDVKPFGLKNSDAQYLVVSDEMFDSLLSGKLAIGVDIFYQSNDASKLQDDIDSLLKGETYYSVKNVEEDAKVMNNIFTLVGIFLYGFIIVITLIGVTNIFNTITTNMELRKPEFAMLKSVGMTSKEFNRMIRLETLFMGIKSLFFGISIGIGLSYLMYYFLAKDSGSPYKLPILAIIIAIVGVYLLISLIMRYSISKIKKQNTIETIRNENI